MFSWVYLYLCFIKFMVIFLCSARLWNLNHFLSLKSRKSSYLEDFSIPMWTILDDLCANYFYVIHFSHLLSWPHTLKHFHSWTLIGHFLLLSRLIHRTLFRLYLLFSVSYAHMLIFLLLYASHSHEHIWAIPATYSDPPALTVAQVLYLNLWSKSVRT